MPNALFRRTTPIFMSASQCVRVPSTANLFRVTLLYMTIGVNTSIFIFANEIGLYAEVNGAPGAIPTRDLPLRRRTLYATELREHKREW